MIKGAPVASIALSRQPQYSVLGLFEQKAGGESRALSRPILSFEGGLVRDRPD